ncbi:VOC family protein [Streptomyces milbemycinicus]|uniref:VOC family protein n=1 Tax=Streptomyces milbemycinicus TaxID=476552 RepID=A0ABW8LDP6_9ACTN
MLTIDHISLGSRNIYAGTEQLCTETGFGQYEGGWFPHLGIANRIVPLGPDQYIEVESVIDAYSPHTNPSARWFYDQIEGGDVFIGWCLRVDTRDELQKLAEHFGTDIIDKPLRKRTDGVQRNAIRVPETIPCWQRGVPNVFLIEDLSEHPGAQPREGQRNTPQGITWMEVGGTEADMRAWLGDGAADLPLKYNGGRPGLYAVAVATDEGEVVIRRTAVTEPRQPASLDGSRT